MTKNKEWFPVGRDPKMLEHTPSTEVVRFTYTWFMWEDGYATNDEAGQDNSIAKFERWLAEVKEEAFKEGYASAGIAALIQVLEVAKVQVEEGADDE
jgi:hypothetical protein